MKYLLLALVWSVSVIVAGVGSKPVASSPVKTHATPHPSPRPSPSPIPSPLESLTPDEILGRTQQTLRRNEDPPYIVYTMHEIFVHHGRSHDYTYHVWYRSDGKGLMQSQSPGRRGRPETFFGYPFPSAPDNNILLYATPAPVSPPPAPVSPPPGTTPPPLLTHEAVHGDRYYVVSLAGIETLDGHEVYHLTLRALRDESRHPWKELWVDTRSFQVWKAHADAGGSSGPLTGRAIADVEFAPVGTYWMVKRATADAQGRFGFISDSGHYEYYFSDFSFPMTLPDWYFDEAAFDQHRP